MMIWAFTTRSGIASMPADPGGTDVARTINMSEMCRRSGSHFFNIDRSLDSQCLLFSLI